MFDKVISGIYQGKLYQKKDVRESESFYNYHIFDISDGCSFVAEKITDGSRPLGDSLYSIMPPELISETVSHMKSYTEIPMFVRTDRGIALLLSHLVPCASLGILIFPYFGGDRLLRIYKHKRWGVAYGTGTETISVRYSKNCVKYTPLAETLYERISSAFGWTTSAFATDMCGDITSCLEDRIYAMSYFTGCPVGIVCNEPIKVVAEFDFPMFTVFLLIMSTVVCRVSPNNELSVTLSKSDDEVEIRIDFVSNGRALSRDISLQALKRIMDRKRMCIVPFGQDNIANYKFYPTVRDWSLLGIKSPKGKDDGNIVLDTENQ